MATQEAFAWLLIKHYKGMFATFFHTDIVFEYSLHCSIYSFPNLVPSSLKHVEIEIGVGSSNLLLLNGVSRFIKVKHARW